MDFRISKRTKENHESKYEKEVLDHAYNFAKKIHKEAGDLIKGVILFGSAARKKQKSNDIDILLILDDLNFVLTNELIEAYRIITEKIIAEVSTRLHITTLKFTTFWEYARSGDAIAVNILRDGVPLVDHGFFEPLQRLLQQGRIRPSEESVWAYYQRAPRAIRNCKAHILEAIMDLYWAVMDASHAVLMHHDVVPASPNHVPELMKQHFGSRLSKNLLNHVEKMYHLSKAITNQEIKELNGKDFDKLVSDSELFVNEMRKMLD